MPAEITAKRADPLWVDGAAIEALDAVVTWTQRAVVTWTQKDGS